MQKCQPFTHCKTKRRHIKSDELYETGGELSKKNYFCSIPLKTFNLLNDIHTLVIKILLSVMLIN